MNDRNMKNQIEMKFGKFECLSWISYEISCQVVVGFGYMTSCIAPSLQIALAISAPLLIPLMIFGGFFLDSKYEKFNMTGQSL